MKELTHEQVGSMIKPLTEDELEKYAVLIDKENPAVSGFIVSFLRTLNEVPILTPSILATEFILMYRMARISAGEGDLDISNVELPPLPDDCNGYETFDCQSCKSVSCPLNHIKRN